MPLTEPYTWAKALHVAAALLFVSGVLIAAVVLSGLAGAADRPAHPVVRFARRWDQRVTTPAMVATWGLGLFLGLTGGWFASGWLMAKLVFVVALSGLHGVLSARLRRVASGAPATRIAWSPAVVASLAALIAILAVTKI